VIWRYMPEATFQYNESNGWCKTGTVTINNARPLQGALAQALSQQLDRWKALGENRLFPDPHRQPGKYTVGEPYQVEYSVWPLIFTCRICGQVHYYKDIESLRQYNDRLGCRTCKGENRLRQVPYGFVCECGHIASLYIPKHEQSHVLQLVDRGNFRESYWYCKTCSMPINRENGLGFRSCVCSGKKFMRGMILEDSRVYYSQTINLVDIEPQALERWQDNDRFSDLLFAAAIYLDAYKPSHILDLASWRPAVSGLSAELQRTKEILMQSGMPEEQADAIVQQSARDTGGDPWAAYDQSLRLFGETKLRADWKASRQTTEYVFVRDDASTCAISLAQIIREAREREDFEAVKRLQSEKEMAAHLGLVNLQVVQALPILLAGVGYSRYFGSPNEEGEEGGPKSRRAELRPFPAINHKIPIYAARNKTEAIMYELDPWRVAAFVTMNGGKAPPDNARVTHSAIRSWVLYQCLPMLETGESHLVLRPLEIGDGHMVDEPSALIFGVLHTLSHVLKATAHQYVGIDSDSLAEYLFSAHTAGLLYAASNVEFTLGGIDAVFRANLTQWLGSARDFVATCRLDPVCSRSGGACLACLFPKFGCTYFNRTVSRAFLLGGKVDGKSEPLVGFWSQAVTTMVESWKADVGTA
jgi:hypothetical protein